MSPSESRTVTKTAQGSKAERAYDLILSRMLDGTYPPKSRLVLERVALDLGVSTLPVREAIRRLEAEGYVEFRQNVGATVAAIDAVSYVQAVETMAVLEGAATVHAAPHLTAAQISQLRELNREMEGALDRLDGRANADLHDAFHDLLISPCPNVHLVDVITKERTRLRRLRTSLLGLGATGGRRDIADHDELIDLIESGAAPDGIEDIARAHLERTVESLRQAT